MIERRSVEEHVVHVRHGGSVPVPEGLIERCGTVEHTAHGCNGGSIPVLDGLVKRGCTSEHDGHSGDGGSIPVADGLVECSGVVEHGVHVGDLAHVPWLDELVEGGGAIEHGPHAGDVADVPTAEVLVEGSGVLEHPAHVGDGGNVPVTDRPVEGIGVLEHGVHPSNRTNVPVGNILVERSGPVEHFAHVRHGVHVPSTDVFVEGSSVLEGIRHVSHGGDVPVAYVPVGGDGGRLIGKPQVDCGGEVGVGQDGARRGRRRPAFLVEEVDGADVGKAVSRGILGADGKGIAGHRNGNTEEGVGAGIGSGHLTESGYGAIVLEAVEVGGACVRLAVDVVPNGARGEQVAADGNGVAVGVVAGGIESVHPVQVRDCIVGLDAAQLDDAGVLDREIVYHVGELGPDEEEVAVEGDCLAEPLRVGTRRRLLA